MWYFNMLMNGIDLNPHVVTLGFFWYIAFLFSTVCHEGAHALAAKLGGDPTAFEAGQVSLNPVPHIQRSPFGLILVPLISYFLNGWMIGWASAPYDPNWERNHPRRSALMSLAGPGANCTLMLLAAFAIRFGLRYGIFEYGSGDSFASLVEATNPEQWGFLATLLSIFFMLNLILMTFNLLPVPPLDGSTGIALFLPEKTAVRLLDFYRNSQMSFMGIVLAWLVYGKLFNRIARIAIGLLFTNI